MLAGARTLAHGGHLGAGGRGGGGGQGGSRGCLVISWRMWQSGRGGYLITGTLRQHTVTPPGVRCWALALVALAEQVALVALFAAIATAHSV